jgi:antitoxin (DNA-binding transcriptional repressor) of toxin-antitoxin stability system
MSHRTLELPEPPSELQTLIDDAVQNGEIVLTRHGTAMAKIVPLHAQNSAKPRTFGSAKGLGVVPDDFNAPLDDFKDYM